MKNNPDYLWRPDPKGEELPQTLFGMPIIFNDFLEGRDFICVLGTLDEYVVSRPITTEELRALLAGKAIVIVEEVKDVRNGENV